MQKQEDEGTGVVELLPCPFCGNPGYITKTPNNDYMADCRACDARIVYFGTRQEAIKAWNTRHTPDVAQGVEARVARIVAALDELRKPAIFGAEEARRKNRYDLKREFNLIAEAYDKAIAIAREEGE